MDGASGLRSELRRARSNSCVPPSRSSSEFGIQNLCTLSSEDDSDMPANAAGLLAYNSARSSSSNSTSGSLHRRVSVPSPLGQASFSGSEKTAAGARGTGKKATVTKSKSFSARFRRKAKQLATIYEAEESCGTCCEDASLIVYFSDVMCLSKPVFVVVPDSQFTREMRTAFEAAHNCDYTLSSESSDDNWELKAQALYLLDADNPFVRAWKKERLAFSAALVDKNGNRLLPGHLARNYCNGTGSSAPGSTITHWYLIKRPF